MQGVKGLIKSAVSKDKSIVEVKGALAPKLIISPTGLGLREPCLCCVQCLRLTYQDVPRLTVSHALQQSALVLTRVLGLFLLASSKSGV